MKDVQLEIHRDLIEPIIAPKIPVHISVPVLLGVGGVAYGVTRYDYYWENVVENSDVFFIADIGLEVELNLVSFFRLTLGAYYRYTNDINVYYYGSNDLAIPSNALRGWHTSLTF